MDGIYEFAHTNVGYSHIKDNKVCQDCSTCYSDDTMSIIVISDGHGSSNFTRSDRGSQYACTVAINSAKIFLQNVLIDDLKNATKRDAIITQLCKSIVNAWNKLVYEDVANNKFSEEEVAEVSDKYRMKYMRGESVEHAYGCTLILILMTENYWIGIRNGDGECVAVDRSGEMTKPIPWNDACEYNVVTSLCDNDTINQFRYFFSERLPAAVFIGSDGVDNSYTNDEELYHLYRLACLKVLGESVEKVSNDIKSFLPQLTERGSGDDVSIAALLNKSYLSEAETGLLTADAAYKRKIEQAERKKQLDILEYNIKVANKKYNQVMQEIAEIEEQIQIKKKKWRILDDDINSLKKRLVELKDICTKSKADITQNELGIEEIRKQCDVNDRTSIKSVGEIGGIVKVEDSKEDEVLGAVDNSEIKEVGEEPFATIRTSEESGNNTQELRNNELSEEEPHISETNSNTWVDADNNKWNEDFQ